MDRERRTIESLGSLRDTILSDGESVECDPRGGYRHGRSGRSKRAGIAVQAGSGRETVPPELEIVSRLQASAVGTGSDPEPASDRRQRLTTQHPLDVLCGGMYRACSTWQYEVAAHLIEQYLGGQRLGYLTGDQYAALMRSDASNASDRSRAKQPMEGRQVA